MYQGILKRLYKYRECKKKKEGEMVLKGSSIDADAKTRNRAKEIQKLVKPKLKKNSTMTATAKVHKYRLVLSISTLNSQFLNLNKRKQLIYCRENH